MNKIYLNAFTIVEAIVSLILTAIIISMVFIIFNITAERLNDFKKQNETVSELNRLHYTINKNIFESENMSMVDNTIIFKGFDGTLANYTFNESEIIYNRKQLTDTFKIKIEKINADTIKALEKKAAYQRLQLKVKKEGVPNTSFINFYKKIYAANLLKQRHKNEY